jgi:hypothetical protein
MAPKMAYAIITAVVWYCVVSAVWASGFATAPLLSQVVTGFVVMVATIVFLDAIKELKK